MVTLPKIIFFGTPEIAVPVLEAVSKEFEVVAVVTNTDKEQGRGRKIQSSEIKICAEKLGLPILQPEDLNSTDFVEVLKKYDADIYLVFAFKILPPKILSLPKIGLFNIHPSLLPRYRGAAPINQTIINGDAETGITTFLLEEKVDSGGILLQDKFALPKDITAGDLYEIVMQKAPDLALRTIRRLASGDKSVKVQNPELVTKAPKLFRENCEINFDQTAEKVKNFINGVSPVPGAWKIWDGKNVKFLRATTSELAHLKKGEYEIKDKKFLIGCADKAIEILQLQSEGKKITSSTDFINGFHYVTRGMIE